MNEEKCKKIKCGTFQKVGRVFGKGMGYRKRRESDVKKNVDEKKKWCEMV